MDQYALEAVRTRNMFYGVSYKYSLLALLISLIVTVLLAGILLWQYRSDPEPVYFATNQDGSLKVMIPLYLPYVSDKTVLDFTSETVLWTFSYDFLNFRNSLQNVRTRFTPAGYQNFVDALTQSENLRTVLEKKFAVTTVFVGDPVIIQKGVLPSTNTYAWQIQIPMDLRYISSQEEKTQPVTASITVVRVSSLLNENLIAIASLILSDRISPNPVDKRVMLDEI